MQKDVDASKAEEMDGALAAGWHLKSIPRRRRRGTVAARRSRRRL